LLPTLRARRNGAEAEGRVVRIRSSRNGVGTTHIPVVTFTALDGQKVEFLDGVASAQRFRQPGDVVAVRYNPADPAHSATIAEGGDVVRSVMISAGMFVFSGLLLLYGLLLIAGVLKTQ